MTSGPDRWSVVERLFHEALARPVDQRQAFLQEVCAGDERLRREVQRLLEAAVSAEEILKAPAPHVAAAGLGESATLPGQRLGVYEAHERIGAGGMGEVYRARDTRLGRDVAIKILPRAFTADPDRLARFEREARILAALNHPNIATRRAERRPADETV
jgi:serine/threonine protein kinase